VQGLVVAVSCNSAHTFSKPNQPGIRLLPGLGVEGDAHSGITVQHLSRIAVDPTQPNLRQVHLMHAELFDQLRTAGLVVAPGDMGENITTRGIDLLGLPTGTLLHVGTSAVLEVTGLRNPCLQLDGFQPGLLDAVRATTVLGPKTGIMSIVLTGGEVRPGDAIRVELPPPPHCRLERV
jgi:MOSC domain-containing protein YiiM